MILTSNVLCSLSLKIVLGINCDLDRESTRLVVIRSIDWIVILVKSVRLKVL